MIIITPRIGFYFHKIYTKKYFSINKSNWTKFQNGKNKMTKIFIYSNNTKRKQILDFYIVINCELIQK